MRLKQEFGASQGSQRFDVMVPTPSAEQALAILRDASQFKWYIIPIFLLVLLAYANEIEKKKWSIVLGAVALWGMDLFTEI